MGFLFGAEGLGPTIKIIIYCRCCSGGFFLLVVMMVDVTVPADLALKDFRILPALLALVVRCLSCCQRLRFYLLYYLSDSMTLSFVNGC